ncbi:MAG: FMN-binding protein [Rectinemataceae bacterium]
MAVAILIAVVTGMAGASESIDDLNPLFKALPANRFAVFEDWEKIRSPDFPLSRVTGIFIGLSTDGAPQGIVVHAVTEGYGGKMALLVAFDMKGRILNVPVVNHNETQCHVKGMIDGSFGGQFVGLDIVDKVRLMVGKKGEAKGDIDAMSGGTVTSRAFTEAVAESRIAFFLATLHGLPDRF